MLDPTSSMWSFGSGFGGSGSAAPTIYMFLKVVYNEKEGGSGGCPLCWYQSQTVAIDVCLFFNFVVVVYIKYFHFRLVKLNE